MKKDIKNNRVKYLYKIEYLNAKEGQARFYIGSRICYTTPEKDLFVKYFTSSKIINQIVAEEGIDAFNIIFTDIKDTESILHEEHLLLKKVDARNNPDYFNQHNNENYEDLSKVNIVCPHCKKKNFDNPFAKCTYCNKVMNTFKCKNCGTELNNPNERCPECNYSRVDDVEYQCAKCGSTLSSPNERCPKCNYSRVDNVEFECEKCGTKLNNLNERCPKCNYSRVDDVEYECK